MLEKLLIKLYFVIFFVQHTVKFRKPYCYAACKAQEKERNRIGLLVLTFYMEDMLIKKEEKTSFHTVSIFWTGKKVMFEWIIWLGL